MSIFPPELERSLSRLASRAARRTAFWELHVPALIWFGGWAVILTLILA